MCMLLGNPHFMTDPIIAKAVAQHIAQSFSAVDPPNAAAYDANYKKFESDDQREIAGVGHGHAAV